MALRDQPYIPLYVQDLLTDEKLMECSAASHGVYFRLLCILHKQEEYGVILLKQKDKQTDNQIKNFALKLAKPLPFDLLLIEKCIAELECEKVIHIEGDKLIQKRMQKDGLISDERSKAGKLGGKTTQSKTEKKDLFAKAKSEAKSKQNTEYVFENEDESISEKQIKLFNDILNFFEYNTIDFINQKTFVHAFVFSLPFHNKLDFAIDQLNAYFQLKKQDKFPHKIENLLGEQSDQFKNGKWDDNWIKQLNDYNTKTKNNGAKSQQNTDNRSSHNPKPNKGFGKL